MRFRSASISILILGAAVISLIMFPGCSKDEKPDTSYMAICQNGHFIGKPESETGVLSFKGIPYAKAPVGELRWKAPVAPDPSDEVKTAYDFGYSSIQYEWFSEPLQTPVSEDCLTLNVWTCDLSAGKKPVMVFFHGGSYAWGGTSEPIYDGQYVVSAHPDVVMVTCNYRVGMMGFINFDGITGGEDYADSKNLGVLDVIMSLQWVKDNVAAFGGDPDNVTIFGESAGAGLVSMLLNTDSAGTLFQRAIIQSGAANLMFQKDNALPAMQRNVRALMSLTGCSSVQELCALTEDQLIEANETECDADGNTPNDLYNVPLCGSYPLHDDPYESLRSGRAKDVDILIGTNLDEINYWINEMGDKPLSHMTAEERQEAVELFRDWYIPATYENIMGQITEEEQASVAQYLALYPSMEDYLAKSRLIGDISYRQPSIKMAETHAGAGSGRTYMYLFEKRNASDDLVGAAHSMELPYVFLNPDEVDTYGVVDMNLAHDISDAWVNFAKTGSPSWPEYDAKTRQTMVFGDDCTLKVVSDPYSTERKLLQFTWKYNLHQIAGS